MGLFKSKKQTAEVLAEHKFDYINLADFHIHSFWAGFAYVTIYIGIIISLGAYAADIYTAASLLIFNKWSSKLQPVVDFNISKWIFAGCIILSFVVLAIEWIISIRVLKGHGVADIYLNSNAQRWSCVFGGRGRKEDTGWKRFLVFARLTKSKRGVDYVALFTYFSFKGWIRTIFAEGPRQAINALTLYSVMQADIIPHNFHKGEELGAMIKFFENFAALGRQDQAQAFILGSMLFTLIIWVIAMLQLLIAAALYCTFLCHVIGSDTSLYEYCKVRVDEKLGDIVASNHKKELARQQKAVTSKSDGAERSGNSNSVLARQPTLPLSLLEEAGVTEKSRVSIVSRPTDANGNRLPKLPNVAELEKPAPVASPIEIQSRMGNTRSYQPRPYGPTRSATTATTATTATSDSRLNLLSDQAGMGYGGRGLERNPSSTAASIYTQRSGYDKYGNPESPLSMITPTTGAPSVGWPTPTPSRQQMRPSLLLAQQGYGINGGIKNGPEIYGQQQQNFGRKGPPRGDYFGIYDNHRNHDNRSNYDNQSDYDYNGNKYDGYAYNRYEENSMYPATYNNSQHAIPDHQEYTSPVRTQTQNSQRQYGGYNSSNTSPVPPPQSAYAPPPLPHVITSTSNPPASATSTAPTNLSRNQSSDVDDSRSIHSQGRQLLLNDFDFELGKKGDEGNSGAGGLGMEIELTPQTPVVSGVARSGGEVAANSEVEETRSQGNHAETSTFGGEKSSRASAETSRSTSPKPANSAMKSTQEPVQQQYTAYNPSITTSSLTSRNLTTTRSPPTPVRCATTTNMKTFSEPIDYFNSASAPRRIGTAPPAAATSVQQRRPQIDYFGTERTPARAGTAPPRGPRPQERNPTSSPREQREQSPRMGVRRAETAPVDFSPRDQRGLKGLRHTRRDSDDVGDMV